MTRRADSPGIHSSQLHFRAGTQCTRSSVFSHSPPLVCRCALEFYYHGISAAILVIVPASLAIFFTKKHGFCNCVFNAAQFTLCLYVAERVGLWAGWRPGVPADSRALLTILLMILTYDFLNAAIVSMMVCVGKRKPYWECLMQTGFLQRRALLPQQVFLSAVAMSLSSHMGNTAIVLMFIGVISLRLQSMSQRELILRTEEAQ